jgi:hypothetical protein
MCWKAITRCKSSRVCLRVSEQSGIVLLGNWRGIPLYVSEEQYQDATGTMQYYVPPKEVLVAATGIQGVIAMTRTFEAAFGVGLVEGPQADLRSLSAVERSCQEWLLHKLPATRPLAFPARKGVKACQVPRGRLSTPVQA